MDTDAHVAAGGATPPDPLIGRVLAGRYEIGALLGAGGMGAVYSARQEPLGRNVVVKVMHPEYARDAQFRDRFIREAKAVCALSHPNIVSVYDFGATDDGLLFIAMERLQGRTLADVLRASGALPEERVLRIISSIARALAEVHVLGIVHRDLKPENVFVTTSTTGDDIVKVLDFGLAKVMPTRTASRAEQSLIVGTPGYMSPEQMQGKEIGPRSDVYALGLIWWEMLVGRAPFGDVADIHERMLRQIVDGIPAPSTKQRLALAPGHEDTLMRALAKDPSVRPANAAELLQAIRAFAHALWLDVSGETSAGPSAPTLPATVASDVKPLFSPQPTATPPTKIERSKPKPQPQISSALSSDKPIALYVVGALIVAALVVAIVLFVHPSSPVITPSTTTATTTIEPSAPTNAANAQVDAASASVNAASAPVNAASAPVNAASAPVNAASAPTDAAVAAPSGTPKKSEPAKKDGKNKKPLPRNGVIDPFAG